MKLTLRNAKLLMPFCTAVFAGLIGLGGCSDDEDGGGGDSNGPEPGSTGSGCEVADDCFPDVAEGELAGDAQCLDRVDGGYCTHLCESDEDCCAAAGECPDDFAQVCSPFESTGLNMCFLSCEEEDILAAAGGAGAEAPDDANEFCQRGAGPDFICRSSGGGSTNRKVCVPGDCGVGADCATDDDCTGDLTCLKTFAGGYCGVADCTGDADCPADSVCVDEGDGVQVCLRTCERASDCSFCRDASVAGDCDPDANLVESSGVSVCRPARAN